MPQKKATQKTATKSSAALSAEERAAMREMLRERKSAATKEENEKTVRDVIAKLPPPDRAIGQRIHAIVKENAPELAAKTWYGMPAYAKDDKVICFFKPASKFKERYATFGFDTAAHIDDGAMWPTSFAITKLAATDEAKIAALVKKAVR